MDDLKNIFEDINEIINLKSKEIKKGRLIEKRIIENSEKIREMILEEDNKKKLDHILSKLKSNYSKLLKDLKNAKKTELSSDWRQFARRDLSVFKDEVLLLQEFLISNQRQIKKNYAKLEYGIDLWDLANSLKKENCIDELTLSNFLRLLKDMDEMETERKSKEFEEDLKRISRCIRALKEVEAEIPHVKK